MSVVTMYGCTDVGQRHQNEDSFLTDADLALAVVADGMGGHAYGEVASRMVVDTVRNEIAAGHSLGRALLQSDSAVSAAATGHDRDAMGAAVVAALFDAYDYEICWVGDCRAYLWTGELVQLTRDHSYVESLLSKGLISWDEAQVRHDRNLITQAIGGNRDESLEVGCVSGSLTRGEELLLCSDGLNDVLTGSDMAAILALEAEPGERCRQLVQAALGAGGRDNITALLIAPGEGAPQAPPRRPDAVSISRLDGSVEYFPIGGGQAFSSPASRNAGAAGPGTDLSAALNRAAPREKMSYRAETPPQPPGTHDRHRATLRRIGIGVFALVAVLAAWLLLG